jgi:hypothetical protein
MDLSEFQPSVAAEAKQSDVETAEDTAISRCPKMPSYSRAAIERMREISCLSVISEKSLGCAALKGTLQLNASWSISAG